MLKILVNNLILKLSDAKDLDERKVIRTRLLAVKEIKSSKLKANFS